MQGIAARLPTVGARIAALVGFDGNRVARQLAQNIAQNARCQNNAAVFFDFCRNQELLIAGRDSLNITHKTVQIDIPGGSLLSQICICYFCFDFGTSA